MSDPYKRELKSCFKILGDTCPREDIYKRCRIYVDRATENRSSFYIKDISERPSNIALDLQLAFTSRIPMGVAFLDLMMDAEGASTLCVEFGNCR